MLEIQEVKVLGIVLVINKIIICFAQVFEHFKYGIANVREQSAFALRISSEDFMSFVFLFLDHAWYMTVLIFLQGLDHTSSKLYFLEGKRLQSNRSCGLGIKRNG